MRKYEFDCNYGMSYSSWLYNRQEINRFAKILRELKKSKPDILRQMVLESLVRLHIQEQRLNDRRYFWDGETTSYAKTAPHERDILEEDMKRKEREWDKYMPNIMKWKLEYMKLALANDISIDLQGDITQLFKAIDTDGKEK